MASASPFSLNSGYYYSPELLAYNSLSSLQPEIDYFQADESFASYFSSGEEIDMFRNDIFSCGMMVLELALLTRVSPSIDLQHGVIRFEML